MELSDIKSIWHQYDTRLERVLRVNLHCIELIQTQKMRSKLAPIFRGRITEIVLHGIVVALLLAFLFNNLLQPRYAASALLLLTFYVIAIVNCVQQIMIIKRMDYSSDIITIQSSLVMLQTHILHYARLAVLCMPTFLAYPVVVSKAIKDLGLSSRIPFDIIAQSNGNWWTAQLVATIVLIPLCAWCYLQLTHKNIHRKWVRNFIERSSGTRVRKAMEFVSELDALKQ